MLYSGIICNRQNPILFYEEYRNIFIYYQQILDHIVENSESILQAGNHYCNLLQKIAFIVKMQLFAQI